MMKPALMFCLLLAPLATRPAGRTLTNVPLFAKLRGSSFQPLEDRDLMTSNDWNCRIK